MAMYTRAEIRDQVLLHLTVLAAGEIASAEDQTLIDSLIVSLIDGELAKVGALPDGLGSESFPEWSQIAVRDVIALRAASLFGKLDKIAAYASAAQEGWALLVRHLGQQANFANASEEIAHLAGRKLAIIQVGEVLPAASKTALIKALEQLFAWFSERGTVIFPIDQIPDWQKPLLRDMLALRAASDFRIIDPIRIQMLQQDSQSAWTQYSQRGLAAIGDIDTRSQLVNRVLRYLQLIGPAETAGPGQYEVVSDGIGYGFGMLARDNVVTFSMENIPHRAMVPLRDYIACAVAEELGITDPNRLLLLANNKEIALRELKAQSRVAKGPNPTPGNYF